MKEPEVMTILFVKSMVWAARVMLGDRWPTPPTADSLAFAVTESAEAIDVELRNNPLYRRNNERLSTIDEELADTIIMLVTALQDELTEDSLGRYCEEVDSMGCVSNLSIVMSYTAGALLEWGSEQEYTTPPGQDPNWVREAHMALIYACRALILYPAPAVANRLNTILLKWGLDKPNEQSD